MKDITRLFFDIETGIAPDADLFKPNFTAPKKNKDGTDNKKDKTIEEQETEWRSKLALSPLTGQVLMVGINGIGGMYMDYIGNTNTQNEQCLLANVVSIINKRDLIIGHYIKDFDLPFIINRSRKYGLNTTGLGYVKGGRWYWSEKIIDLKELWTFSKYGEHISLNNMAKFFGLEVKDETIGKNFQQVFESDIEKAIAYCKHDVELTKEIYERLK